MSGIKALCRALSAQVPFTEATLYTPRKCFERASEKCHVDSLAGIVASCSWGKRVAVGTGTKFDVLWDTKEIEVDEKPIDVYNFLHLVRSSNEEEMDTGCLGEDIDKFDWEDTYMEPALSPDQENNAVFEEVVEIGLDSQEQGGGDSGWNVGSGPAEGNGWANWGPKKDTAQAEDNSKSGGWDAPKSLDNGSVSWGSKRDQAQPEDNSTGGWGAPKSQDNGSVSWGSKKDQAQPEDSSKSVGWGTSKTQNFEKEGGKNPAWDSAHSSGPEKATWGAPSAASWKKNSNNGDDNGACGSESENERNKTESSWGQTKDSSWKEKTPQNSDGWASKKSAGTNSQGWNAQETKQPWNSPRTDGGEKSSLETPSGASWSKGRNQDGGAGGWRSEKKESNTQSSWGQQSGSSFNNNHEAGSGGWGSQKEEKRAESSWRQEKNSSGGAGGWSSDKVQKESGFRSWDSKNDEGKSQTSLGQSNNSTWKKSDQSANEWGSDKLSKPGSSMGWDSAKATVASSGKDYEEGGSGGWESKKGESKTQSTWGQPKKATSSWGSGNGESGSLDKWSSQEAKDNEVGGSKSWESRKGQNSTQSTWSQPRNATSNSDTDAWGSKKSDQRPSSSSWGSGKGNSGGSDKWSSQDAKNNEVGGSKTWESRTGQNGTQSTWGQPSNATNENDKQTDAWDSKKSDQPQSSSSWGSAKVESGSLDKWSSQDAKDNEVGGSNSWESRKGQNIVQSTWGEPRNTTSKKDKQTDSWATKKSDEPHGSSSWGSGKVESGSSDKVFEEDISRAWDKKTEETKTQSSWGQPRDSSPSVDGWDSNKSVQPQSSSGWGSGKAVSDSSTKAREDDSSGAWGSKTEDGKTQSSWGQKSETTWKSSPSADGWGSNKMNQSGQSFGRGSGKPDNGGRGWGSSNSGEWKSRKNRPPKQPGSNDDFANVAFTATRKRMDIFPAEEQDALSEVETIMQSIRRIMHQSGCNDGDPLPSDDQSFIINNVLEYHPDKAAKMGAGIDFITVKKHGNFQESRCFFVVSTDGQAEDFSYIKCLENFIKGKYPSIAESFNSKYFRKPRAGGNRPQGPRNFTHNAPDSPNFTQSAPESPNLTQNAPESPNFTQTAPESPNFTQNAPDS